MSGFGDIFKSGYSNSLEAYLDGGGSYGGPGYSNSLEAYLGVGGSYGGSGNSNSLESYLGGGGSYGGYGGLASYTGGGGSYGEYGGLGASAGYSNGGFFGSGSGGSGGSSGGSGGRSGGRSDGRSTGTQDQTPEKWYDNRCSSIASGDILFTDSGYIDRRSAAVRSKAVSLNKDGFPRVNSAAINQGDLYTKPTNIPANSERKAFTEAQIDNAWNRGERIPGANPDVYRKDRAGNTLYYHSYGLNTAMGWQVDHSRPLASGGQMHHPNNHQPLQSGQNASKGSQPSGSYFANCTPMGISPIRAADVDYRSKLVRNGELSFKPDGTVDRKSYAVRSGDVIVTESGEVDRRSAAVRRGDVIEQ